MEDHPEANPQEVHQWAMDNAWIFDMRAHSWAEKDVDGGGDVREYYETWAPVWRSQYGREAEIRREFGTMDNGFLEQFGEGSTPPLETPAEPPASTGKSKRKKKGGQESLPIEPEAASEPIEVTPVTPEERGEIFVETAKPGIAGNTGSIVTSKGDVPMHYEVRELDDVTPSHDPTQEFRRRNDYPAEVQARPYHSDYGEQDKVRMNALRLDPRYVINDNPDATTGPPVVTKGGIALGGNSRSMSLGLARDTDRFTGYREYLKQNAQRFGIDPAQIEGMKHPVLVRVVDKDMSLKEMAEASHLFNEVTTQSIQSEADGVSKAKLLRRETVSMINNRLDEGGFDTLRQFLDSESSKGVVEALIKDGVIEQQKISTLVDEKGYLNSRGKDLVEDVLRGFVLPSYDIIRKSPASVIDKVDRSLPLLAQLKAVGGEWDLQKVLVDALNLINVARGKDATATVKHIQAYMNQGTLGGGKKYSQSSQILAMTLVTAPQHEVAARIGQFVAYARQFQTLSGGLLGEAAVKVNAGDAFIASFLRPVVTAKEGKAVRLVPGFDPAKNIDHRAIEFLQANGGMQESLKKLQERLGDTSLPAAQRKETTELLAAVSRMGGPEYRMHEPRVGGPVDAGQTFFQAKGVNQLADRFAAMQPVIAKISDFFGEGKAIHAPLEQRRDALKKWAKDTFTNETQEKNGDTGWDIFITPRGISKTLSHGYDDLLATSVPFVPEIVRSGIYVTKGKISGGMQTHIFANKIDLDGKGYVVGFVVREDQHGRRFYDHELTEIITPDSLNPASPSNEAAMTGTQANRGVVMNILREHLGVNDGTGSIFFQSGSRGSVTFQDNARPVIDFFRASDLTTAPHEVYHVFRRELEATARDARSSAAAKQRWKDICDFVGAREGEAWTTAQEEMFAEAAERYLATGQAPRPELQGIFDRMKEWFLQVYRHISNAGIEVSPRMKEIFDDMLSVDSLPRNGLADVLRGGLSPRSQRDLARAMEKALMDVSNGRPVDVGPVLRDSGVPEQVRNMANEYATPEERAALGNPQQQGELRWDVEAQDAVTEAPPLPGNIEQAHAADLERQQGFEESVNAGVERARQEGLLSEEEVRALEDGKAEAERAQEYDELGRSVMECVWGASA